MRSLDVLAERVVSEPVAAPSPMAVLSDRARRRGRLVRTRRIALGAAVVVPLIVIGGLVATRPEVARIDTADGGSAEVGEVFGSRLADGGVLWPADPVPLDQLLDDVGMRILGWPVVEWDRSDLVGSEGGVTATQPGRPDRWAAMQVRETAPGGWQILSLYPSARVVLTAGELTGFAIDVPVDSARVEVFHLDPIDGTQHRTILADDVGGASSLQLLEPVPAERAGTFVIVARDAAGEATLVAGLSIGSVDRLTVDIDRLLAAGVPAPLPDDVAAIAGEDPYPIDLARSVVVSGITEGVDLFVVPYVDDSAVAFYEVWSSEWGWGGGGGDALSFNRSGYVTSMFHRDESDGHTLVVLPDSIEFSPDLAPLAIADGRVAVLPFIDDLDRFVVVDGVMTLQP